MDELWTTILAPVLDAVRPGLVLCVSGEDRRLAQLAARFVEPWGGRVQSWNRQPGATPPGEAEVVLLHRDDEPALLGELLDAVAAAGEEARRPLPVIVVDGVGGEEGLLAVVRGFTEAAGSEMLVVPGLGGVAIVTERSPESDAYGRLRRLLEELVLSPAAVRHVVAVEDGRLAERMRAERAFDRLAAARDQALENETLRAERDELRTRVRELADAVGQRARGTPMSSPRSTGSASPSKSGNASPPKSAISLRRSEPAVATQPPEPSQADMRKLLNPAELLSDLGWEGPEKDLGLPIPNNVIAEGRSFEWEWPIESPDAPIPSIAYLLPGLPPEGSGGSHSLVQEARGLRTLGAAARVCVPLDALARAERLYGNEDRLFVAYDGEDAIAAVDGAAVVVSTEHTSVRLAERVARERPEVRCAYYVQDYEPLFAPLGSARSDQALLSYRAIPGQVLFAKTHWLRNVVMARHGIPVMKVQPSLDTSLFHPRGRLEREGGTRVAAMIRPRTPRRRARRH